MLNQLHWACRRLLLFRTSCQQRCATSTQLRSLSKVVTEARDVLPLGARNMYLRVRCIAISKCCLRLLFCTVHQPLIQSGLPTRCIQSLLFMLGTQCNTQTEFAPQSSCKRPGLRQQASLRPPLPALNHTCSCTLSLRSRSSPAVYHAAKLTLSCCLCTQVGQQVAMEAAVAMCGCRQTTASTP